MSEALTTYPLVMDDITMTDFRADYIRDSFFILLLIRRIDNLYSLKWIYQNADMFANFPFKTLRL